MRARPSPLKLLCIALVAMAVAVPAVAAPQQSQRPRDRGGLEQERRDDMGSRHSLSDAVRRVERDTRGEVLSAERVQYDGRDMHRVKVVDDRGRVRVFLQDPRRRDDAPRAGRSRPAPTRDDDD